MSTVIVSQLGVEVTLVLNEDEALFVLGVLGQVTGESPDVYRKLTAALREAGYDRHFLYGQSKRVSVIGCTAEEPR